MNDDKNLAPHEQEEVPALEATQALSDQEAVEEIAFDASQKATDVMANPEKPVEFTEDEKDFLRNIQKVNPDRLLKLLKGTAEGDRFSQTIAKLSEYTKQFLAKEHGKSADFYLPSSILLKLFKEGVLEKHGISDKSFVREFDCNKVDFCPNFVHAYTDKDGKLLIDGWFGEDSSRTTKLPDALTEIIKQEMGKMAN